MDQSSKNRNSAKKLGLLLRTSLQLMKAIDLEQLEDYTLQEVTEQTESFPAFVIAFHNKAATLLLGRQIKKKKTNTPTGPLELGRL